MTIGYAASFEHKDLMPGVTRAALLAPNNTVQADLAINRAIDEAVIQPKIEDQSSPMSIGEFISSTIRGSGRGVDQVTYDQTMRRILATWRRLGFSFVGDELQK
jgi:hypothetical protein